VHPRHGGFFVIDHAVTQPPQVPFSPGRQAFRVHLVFGGFRLVVVHLTQLTSVQEQEQISPFGVAGREHEFGAFDGFFGLGDFVLEAGDGAGDAVHGARPHPPLGEARGG
jgi:hypothetical protein